MLKTLAVVVAALVIVAGWRLWTHLFISVATSAGVPWGALTSAERVNVVMTVGLSGIGLILTGIGIYLSGLAVDLGKQANELSAKATSIAEKQERYLDEERAKRAVFQLVRPDVFTGNGKEFALWITNTGRRASRGYFYIGVPKSLKGNVSFSIEQGFKEVAVNSSYDVKDNPFDDPKEPYFHDDYYLRKFEVSIELGPLDRRFAGWLQIDFEELDRTVFNHGFLWFSQTTDTRFPENGVKAVLLVNANEHWIKYGTEETRRKVQAYIDNPDNDSWRTYDVPTPVDNSDPKR